MIVEALVNLNNIGDEKNYAPGDILVIRQENSFWGVGDLQSRIVVQIDMPEFPCGAEWGIRKCVKCEHHGITWPVESLAAGTIGTPKLSCIKEQYEVENMEYIFSFNYQGIPILDGDMKARRMGKLLLDTVISMESQASILTENFRSSYDRIKEINIAVTTLQKLISLNTQKIDSLPLIEDCTESQLEERQVLVDGVLTAQNTNGELFGEIDSINEYLNSQRDAKLLLSRKESNLVTMDKLEVKPITAIKVITK